MTAAKVILLTPELREKYERGGLAAIDEAALTEHGIQVDVSQTGYVTAGLLAMFRKVRHRRSAANTYGTQNAVYSQRAAARMHALTLRVSDHIALYHTRYATPSATRSFVFNIRNPEFRQHHDYFKSDEDVCECSSGSR